METLQIGTIINQVPSAWNELKRKQLLLVLAEVYAKPRRGRQLRLLKLLSGFALPLLATLPVVVLAQLFPLTHWLDSDAHLLTAQLLPTVVIAGRHITERATTWCTLTIQQADGS